MRALIFDSYYDSYRGVIIYFRVTDGVINQRDRIRLMASGKEYDIDELGVLSPNQVPVEELHAGEVGYIAASIKSVEDAPCRRHHHPRQSPRRRSLSRLRRSQADGLLRTVSHRF